jgi:hypothetical protein
LPALKLLQFGPEVFPGNHRYEKAGVPPNALIVAAPVASPKQLTFVIVIMFVIGGGCKISGLVIAEELQPLLSVTII